MIVADPLNQLPAAGLRSQGQVNEHKVTLPSLEPDQWYYLEYSVVIDPNYLEGFEVNVSTGDSNVASWSENVLLHFQDWTPGSDEVYTMNYTHRFQTSHAAPGHDCKCIGGAGCDPVCIANCNAQGSGHQCAANDENDVNWVQACATFCVPSRFQDYEVTFAGNASWERLSVQNIILVEDFDVDSGDCSAEIEATQDEVTRSCMDWFLEYQSLDLLTGQQARAKVAADFAVCEASCAPTQQSLLV